MNRRRMLAWFLLFALIGVVDASAESVRRKVKEGNRLFEEGKIDDALKKYTDAQIDYPTSPVIHYNIGDALYKQEKYDGAMEEFEKSLSSDEPHFASMAYYNQGNSLYRKGDYAKAIEAYQQALKLNPDDEDAKFNLEFVRRKLKENAKQEQSQQPRQEQKNQSQGADQQQQQQDENKKPEKEKQKEDNSKGSAKQEEQKPNQQPESPQSRNPEQGRLTEEQAERMLDAVEREEEQQQEKQMKARFPEGGRRPIDW
jgi:Ca-activated chloride channel family protein